VKVDVFNEKSCVLEQTLAAQDKTT
jgi:hypothetical protein